MFGKKRTKQKPPMAGGKLLFPRLNKLLEKLPLADWLIFKT